MLRTLVTVHPEPQPVDESYREKYYRLEELHWWGIARRDILLRLLEAEGVPKDARILDIGCSSGPLIQHLLGSGYRDVCGIDLSDRAVDLCRKKDLRVQQMDATQLEFPDSSFDVLIASDILEHLLADERALSDWRRVLAPTGKLIVFVPAFRFLWSGHDEVNQHFRRYSKKELELLLERTGYEVERMSFWNTAMFFPVAAVRLLHRLPVLGKEGAVHDIKEGHPVVTRLLSGVLELENRWLAASKDAPIGISLFAVARPRKR